jgi:hypothetical protein
MYNLRKYLKQNPLYKELTTKIETAIQGLKNVMGCKKMMDLVKQITE